MKKIQSVIYPFWIILSFLISIFLMIKLYPNYINNEFPLFTDLTLLLFLPAFFIFSYTLIHLLGSILSSIVAISNKWILLIQAFLIFIAFIISLNFMEFSLGIRIMISIIFIIISSLHFIITRILYRKYSNQI
ncbi:hypothetical protein EDD65_11282 [Keratinibaculum paraultunense]|uniref:Uncharacterized protein n=1 Tax=Keratinibaculum paraultunense TaxID=1278232 RepID=A0A4R3KRP0_9FIRM|nr:hypothetical protein EDD65_11282 [Keratinibaculum paraultunense]